MNDLQPEMAEVSSTNRKRAHRSAKPATAGGGVRKARRGKPTAILLDQSGDWMPAEELREALLARAAAGGDVPVSFGTLSHLETASLQVLLSAGKSVQLHLEFINEVLQSAMHSAGVWAVLQASQREGCTTR